MAIVGVNSVFLTDYGSYEHVFQPVRRFVTPSVDKYFRITDEEIEKAANANKIKLKAEYRRKNKTAEDIVRDN